MSQNKIESENAKKTESFVTFRVAGQLFGVPILEVRDILSAQKITNVPMTSEHIEGLLNLRGVIITVINMRQCFGITTGERESYTDKKMNIVVNIDGELYSLMVDIVGEVLEIDASQLDEAPKTLDKRWRNIAKGISKLENELMVIIDNKSLLQIVKESNNKEEQEKKAANA